MSKRGPAASKKLLTGLIGAPIAHSASPAMHERAAEALGLRGHYQLIEVAGADGKFVPAQDRLDGATMVVSSAQVDSAIAVRYAWADNPDCNLYNGAGLPASPFRTDDWKR